MKTPRAAFVEAMRYLHHAVLGIGGIFPSVHELRTWMMRQAVEAFADAECDGTPEDDEPACVERARIHFEMNPPGVIGDESTALWTAKMREEHAACRAALLEEIR